MLARAERMIGGRVGGKVWGGTFHALGNRLLRLYGRAIGISPDFTVLDQTDAADLLDLIRNDMVWGAFIRIRRFSCPFGPSRIWCREGLMGPFRDARCPRARRSWGEDLSLSDSSLGSMCSRHGCGRSGSHPTRSRGPRSRLKRWESRTAHREDAQVSAVIWAAPTQVSSYVVKCPRPGRRPSVGRRRPQD